MRDRRLQRAVVLGTGTAVGKTHVTACLARALRSLDEPTLALKPVETGAPFTDAASFDRENPIEVRPHPLFALEPAVSPHLAAREVGKEITSDLISMWCNAQEIALCDAMLPHARGWLLIETAGGALTPLSSTLRNFDLVGSLRANHLILVAPDSLGVLNGIDTTLTALGALGRTPDLVVLSAAANEDASTGRNAAELAVLGIAAPVLALARGETDAGPLAQALVARARAR